jgi:hypothetical protein
VTRILALPGVGITEGRGRLLTPDEVATEVLRGEVSPAWVRRNVGYKIRLGRRTVMWYEADVRRWIEEQREAS